MSVSLLQALIGVVIGFGAGSIPFGLLIARSKGVDIRAHGSGNIGATNVGRVLGKKYFFICFVFDALKGLLPTLGFGLWFGLWDGFVGDGVLTPAALWAWLAVMVSPVMGHMFSPWVAFKGGKGVATGLGTLIGFFPLLTVAGVVALLVFLAVLKTWRFVGVASCAAAISLPISVAVWLGTSGSVATAWPVLLVAVALSVLVVIKHRGNLSRTMQGTEPRVGDPIKSAG